MTKKMTVVFHDEELYTDLKIEAVRRHKPASEIIAEAVREWLEEKEAEELIPLIEAAEKEAEEKGYIPWPEVKKRLNKGTSEPKRPIMVAENKDVRS
jgi:hypothetical protein